MGKNLNKEGNIISNWVILILGLAIIAGSVVTMSIYHDMSWQSYVIIGVIILIALWIIIKTFFRKRKNRE